MTVADGTFQKSHRLTRRADFETTLKSGRFFRHAAFQIVCRPREKTGPVRLGIRITKRNFRKAVDRNRIKRWIREYFRGQKCRFHFPCDLIIQVFPGVESQTFESFKKGLEEAFRKARLMKD